MVVVELEAELLVVEIDVRDVAAHDEAVAERRGEHGVRADVQLVELAAVLDEPDDLRVVGPLIPVAPADREGRVVLGGVLGAEQLEVERRVEAEG